LTKHGNRASLRKQSGRLERREQMADFDAIVIGAGHNGLAAAVMLQHAGLRTLCLESKLYAGGMASTVELFDGYQFEIAGSVAWTPCRPSTWT
jgi:phytoene dehydrogenase-like protein